MQLSRRQQRTAELGTGPLKLSNECLLAYGRRPEKEKTEAPSSITQIRTPIGRADAGGGVLREVAEKSPPTAVATAVATKSRGDGNFGMRSRGALKRLTCTYSVEVMGRCSNPSWPADQG